MAKGKFDSASGAMFLADDAERERWREFGLVETEQQDKVFQAMTAAVDVLTRDGGADWRPASDLLPDDSGAMPEGHKLVEIHDVDIQNR